MQSQYHTLDLGIPRPTSPSNAAPLAWAVAAGSCTFAIITLFLSRDHPAQTALFGPTAVRPVVAINTGATIQGMPSNMHTGAQRFASTRVAMQSTQDSRPMPSVMHLPQKAESVFGAFALPAALVASMVGFVLAVRSIKRPERVAMAMSTATTTKISAKDVQALRKQSGAGMMDCKKAFLAP